eukprot:jgi/Botrbrau1/23318/Bobra.0102s0055.1
MSTRSGFLRSTTVNWKDRIVEKGPDWVIVDKPAGVPSVPTVDNVLENVLHCTAQALGRDEALYTTSRLDNCTSGLLVVAKSPAFVAAFNALLRDDAAVQKRYRALTRLPPPLGTAVHYVTVNTRRPGWPSHTAVHAESSPPAASLRCELHVDHVEHVTLSGTAEQLWGPSAYESSVLLVTGRTHQIRAQFGAMGCPLLGDTLYERLSFSQEGFEGSTEPPRMPEGAIGLQSWRLDVMGPSPLSPSACHFEAGLPWWRN